MYRTVVVLLGTAAASGCALQMTLPSLHSEACPFAVTDDRPDPEHVYAKAQAVVQIRTIPTASESLRGAVCATGNPSNLGGSSFTITDFSCTASGYIELTYIVELRGLLATASSLLVELRAGSKIDTAIGYVPTGCEQAASIVIPAMARKIHGALGG